jgi:hypothetical protein
MLKHHSCFCLVKAASGLIAIGHGSDDYTLAPSLECGEIGKRNKLPWGTELWKTTKALSAVFRSSESGEAPEMTASSII